MIAPGGTAAALDVDVTVPADAAPGQVQLTVKTPAGASAPLPFIVDRFTPVMEVEPNDSPRTGQKITLPATVVGADRQGRRRAITTASRRRPARRSACSC